MNLIRFIFFVLPVLFQEFPNVLNYIYIYLNNNFTKKKLLKKNWSISNDFLKNIKENKVKLIIFITLIKIEVKKVETTGMCVFA